MREESPSVSRTGAPRMPLFGIRGIILIVAAIAVIVILLVATYSVGNPRRYTKHLRVTVDNVVTREISADDKATRHVVEVFGTISNTGGRNIRMVELEVLLKTNNGETVGVYRGQIDHASKITVGARNSVTFHVQIEPVSDNWAADRTVARVTNLSFGSS